MANQPKSYRKFLAGSVTAALVASAVAPAVSAAGFPDVKEDDVHADNIAKAVELGLFGGYEDGTFGPYHDIKRGQVAKVLSRYLLEKGEVDTSNIEQFSDVSAEADEELAKAALVVRAAGVFKGSNGELQPYDHITRQEMASVVARLFDLEDKEGVEPTVTDIDEAWDVHADNINLLSEWGLTTEEVFEPLENVKRAQFASFMVRAIETLEEEEVVAPAVESVSAINAEEIQVTFNTKIDKTTASNAVNYELEINGVDKSANIDDIAVDGNTALIRLDDATVFSSGDKFVLQVKDSVKDVNGTQVERYASNEIPFNVTSAPSIVSSGFDGANLTLEFDRPVSATTTLIKLDGVALTNNTLIAVSDDVAGNYEYTVSLNASEQTNAGKAGNHEVVIFDLADTKGTTANVASVVTSNYNLSADQQAPEVVSVQALNANKFFIELSEAAAATDASFTVKKGNHTFTVGGNNADLTTAVNAGAGAELNKVYYEQGTYLGNPGYYVVITEPATGELNPLYKDGETSASLNVTFENYKDSADFIGAKYQGTVVLSKDTNKPAVDTTAISGSNLVIDFDGDLTVAPALSDVVVRDKDGVIITPSGIALNGSDASVVEITLGSVADEPYTVEFAAGKVQYTVVKNDVSAYNLNANKNDLLTTTVQSTANNFFKYVEFLTNGTTPVGVANNVITVDYGVEMSNSALSVSNYQLDGKALPAGTKVDFVGDKTTVKITLPEGEFATSTDYKFTISSNVETKDGVHVVGDLQTKKPYEEVITLTDNVDPTVEGGQFLVTNDTDTTTTDLIVKFSEVLATTPDNSDFKVTVQGSTQTVASISDTDKSDEYVVITLSSAINVGQSATVEVVPEGANNAALSIEDAAGNKATGSVTVSTKTKDAQGN